MTRPTDWNDEQTNALVRLYRKGHTYTRIANKLRPLGKDISAPAVASKAKRMGLTRQTTLTDWTPEEDARLIELWTTTGKTQDAIALVLAAEFPGRRSCTRSSVGSRRHTIGLKRRGIGSRSEKPAADVGRKPALSTLAHAGCKWITNARQLRQQRPHYCGAEAAGNWCAEHKAVLYGREVGG